MQLKSFFTKQKNKKDISYKTTLTVLQKTQLLITVCSIVQPVCTYENAGLMERKVPVDSQI